MTTRWWQDEDDWSCGDDCTWWELHDSWCFHVKVSPWPVRAGKVRLTFRYGPDDSHMRYAVRAEPPVPDAPVGSGQRASHADAPLEWRRFSSEGFRSDGPPFWADVELPPGRVLVAFAVEQQDYRGEWFGEATLEWMLEVSDAGPDEAPRPNPEPQPRPEFEWPF